MRRFAAVLSTMVAAGCSLMPTLMPPPVDPCPAELPDGGESGNGGFICTALDAGSSMGGDAACGPGQQLCDVCGTLGCYAGGCPGVQCGFGCPPGEQACDVCGTTACYAGACPMHSCPAPATCPPQLPEAGSICDQEGVTCGYETSMNACGADNCDCQGGAWNCGPSCAILDAGAGDDGGSDADAASTI